MSRLTAGRRPAACGRLFVRVVHEEQQRMTGDAWVTHKRARKATVHDDLGDPVKAGQGHFAFVSSG